MPAPATVSKLRVRARTEAWPMVAACLVWLPACGSDASTTSSASAAPVEVLSALPIASSDLVHTRLRTTDAALALVDLDSQLAGAERSFDARPDDVDLRKKAVALRLERAGITGSAADREQALVVADAFLKAHSRDFDAHVLRARVLAAHHRFGEALAALDGADAVAKPPQSTEELRLSILAAQGHYDEVYPRYRAIADQHPSPSTLLDLAVLAAHMGKLDEAEAVFVDAEQRFRGATPFLLASIYYERAAMFERAGDLPKATVLYRAAHERLPQHVHVAVHLAALVAPSEGVAILEPLAQGDDVDPDLLAQLGVLKNLLQPKSGEDALARAVARYDALMSRQPYAYADHAGWFWLVAGSDPKKALAAAKQNLEQRQTAEAYELAIAAAQAGGSKSELCAFAARARALPHRTGKLDELLRPLDCPEAAPAASTPP